MDENAVTTRRDIRPSWKRRGRLRSGQRWRDARRDHCCWRGSGQPRGELDDGQTVRARLQARFFGTKPSKRYDRPLIIRRFNCTASCTGSYRSRELDGRAHHRVPTPMANARAEEQLRDRRTIAFFLDLLIGNFLLVTRLDHCNFFRPSRRLVGRPWDGPGLYWLFENSRTA